MEYQDTRSRQKASLASCISVMYGDLQIPPGSIKLPDADMMVSGSLDLIMTIGRSAMDAGLAVEDIVQHGIIGLLEAAHRYDPAINDDFKAYAWRVVKSRIADYIEQNAAPLRLPQEYRDLLERIDIAEAAMAHLMMRFPEDKELAEYASSNLGVGKLTAKRLMGLRSELIGYEDPEDSSPERAIDPPYGMFDLTQLLSHALDIGFLKPREFQVLGHIYGIGMLPHTKDQTAERFDLSRSRIDQIEQRSIRKIRRLVKETEPEMVTTPQY